MNNDKKRLVGAEIALLATMVEVAIIGSIVPEFLEYAKVLVLPFLFYGIYLILFLWRNN